MDDQAVVQTAQIACIALQPHSTDCNRNCTALLDTTQKSQMDDCTSFSASLKIIELSAAPSSSR